MEEDIKILEDLFYDDESFEPIGYIEIFLHKNEQEAIKHLIERNKELEKQNKILKSKQTKIIADSFHEKMAKKFDEDFIPKSKVRGLKENIHYLLDNNGIARAYQIEIDRLFEELLED